MDRVTEYLNTDLELDSAEDLTALVAVFESAGYAAIHTQQHPDGIWRAILESGHNHVGPESNIEELVAFVEALAPPSRAVWDGCTRRVFDIGFDCGSEPRSIVHELPAELLRRIAAVEASVRITLYGVIDE